MSEVMAYVSGGVMLLGALMVLVAMIGTVRFPDVFCRAHALGKGLTLGLMLLLFALWLDPATEVSGLKVLAAIFFQFVTLPVASHLLTRLSFDKNLPRVVRRKNPGESH